MTTINRNNLCIWKIFFEGFCTLPDKRRGIFSPDSKNTLRIGYMDSHDLPFIEKILTEISQEMLWNYRQVVQIPPYLLKNVFSKGSHILPVNEKMDNIIVSFASEVYSLVKAGFGFAFVPQHLAIPDERIVFYNFKETHQCKFWFHNCVISSRNLNVFSVD